MTSRSPHEPINPEAWLDALRTAVEIRTGWTRRQAEIMLNAVALSSLILMCGLAVMFGDALSQTPPPTATPTIVPLPVHSAADVMAQLKQVGVTVQAVQPIPVPNTAWQASQAVQFKVGTSVFLLLSYADVDSASADVFKATNSPAFKNWQVIQVTNVVLVALPGANAGMVNALTSHLTTYLVTPTVTPTR